jgi:phosphoglycerate dehydrogenase-like enzyme
MSVTVSQSSRPEKTGLRVVVLDDYQQVAAAYGPWTDLGAEVGVDFVSEHLAEADQLVARLAGAEVVVAMRERTPFPREILERLPDLQLLVTTAQRNASIDVAAAAERGVVVCGTDFHVHGTAEMTWALILALARNVCVDERALRAGDWQTTVGVDLHGKTLGVLGLGRLGSRVAGIGAAFGMRPIAWSANLTAERCAEKGVALVSKDELFAQSDVLSVHVRLSERTRGLVGAAELAAMKPTAMVINTSRGPIIDETALVAALRSGSIGGAGLDVFDVEPLPADSPLREAPNTVLTPHLGYVTEQTYEIFFRDIVENIAAWRAGEPVRVIPVE